MSSAAPGAATLPSGGTIHGASDPAPRPRALTYMNAEASEALPAVLDHAGLRKTILVGNMVEMDYCVFSWDVTTLKDTGGRVKMNGGPAAIRTAGG